MFEFTAFATPARNELINELLLSKKVINEILFNMKFIPSGLLVWVVGVGCWRGNLNINQRIAFEQEFHSFLHWQRL